MLEVELKSEEYIYHIPLSQNINNNFLIELQFCILYEKWKEERKYLSLMCDIQNTTSYQKIIQMGKDVLPFILKSMQNTPDWWFEALFKITNINPISPQNKGNLAKMTQDWLAWGKSQDLC